MVDHLTGCRVAGVASLRRAVEQRVAGTTKAPHSAALVGTWVGAACVRAEMSPAELRALAQYVMGQADRIESMRSMPQRSAAGGA